MNEKRIINRIKRGFYTNEKIAKAILDAEMPRKKSYWKQVFICILLLTVLYLSIALIIARHG